MNATLTLLTIVGEALFKDELIHLLRRHGATGYTLSRVEGEGSRGIRAEDWEGRNVKIECLLAKETAGLVMEELAKSFFEDHAVVAWSSEVQVLRGEKFVHGVGGGLRMGETSSPGSQGGNPPS